MCKGIFSSLNFKEWMLVFLYGIPILKSYPQCYNIWRLWWAHGEVIMTGLTPLDKETKGPVLSTPSEEQREQSSASLGGFPLPGSRTNVVLWFLLSHLCYCCVPAHAYKNTWCGTWNYWQFHLFLTFSHWWKPLLQNLESPSQFT